MTIPQQLHNPDFGFVKLLPKSKKPFEKNWPNHPHSLTDIQQWFNEGNNYGVLGGCGNLVIVDADSPEMVAYAKEHFPLTFTVKTPKKGVHFYLICPGIDKKIKLKKDDQDHGEIISHGSQVVGPGSIHPDTETAYMVEQDEPIASISVDDLLKILADYIPEQDTETPADNDPAFCALVDQYGQPYYFNKDGNLTGINQSFWAGLHNAEHIQLYEPDERGFYRYDDKTGIYTDITEHLIKNEIAERLLAVSRENSLPALETKRTATTLNHIVAQLKGICERRHAFQKTSNYVHLANGVIVFKDNKEADLLPFSPDLFSRNYCPIAFDASVRCERFLNDLLLPAVTVEDALIIQKYIGLCLLGNNLIQRFLILEGKPGQGKSTLALIIQKLIGQINVTELRTRHLSERFELYRYLKKTLLVGVDVPGKFLSEKGAYVIKGLVGGDWFDTEQKGGTGNFQMKGNFCIVITANSRLQVKLDGDIGAWKRRLLICRFEGPPPAKKIPDFADVLIQQEGSGILNWALEGLGLLLKDIEQIGDIQMPPSQEGVVDALLAESDSLCHFLSDRIERDDHLDLSVPEIVEAYAEYCPSMGWNPKPITVVYRELEGLMLELFGTAKAHSIHRDGKSVKGFRRVKFKGQEPQGWE
ncbi:MAG TPA: bifunctional DNA primase/polymerase [Candidatus Omnitrophota bacterium]|nr:bifunctional DNA primase/polymerase [Candidatus Omnitrophota bacterium]